MTNTNKLKGFIMMSGFRQEEVAKKLGISFQALNSKINNKNQFKAKEIAELRILLKIPDSEVDSVFFMTEG